MKKIVFGMIVVLIMVAFFALPSGAFDGNDYGGGGGYDGGGWDGGSDSSWGGDWGGGISISGDLRNLSKGDQTMIFLFIAVPLIIRLFKYLAQKERKEREESSQEVISRPAPSSTNIMPSSHQGLRVRMPDRTGQIESIIKEHDANFSASDFVSFGKRLYIDIQTAWCKRNLPSVRVFLHDNLYDATSKQIQAKIDQGVVYHYESMVVNTVYLTSYAKDKQFEYLTVYLNARMIDWQEDEKTGRILRGDKTTRWDLRYKMKFMRSVGVLTRTETAEKTKHNCPNCGAPLEMVSSAKCLYCDSNITTGQYSWVLSDFGTIRDDTIDEGIRTN